MANIYFAHPRHDYASYTDYKRLITLAGYPQLYHDEIDHDSDNLYIISSPDHSLYKGFENARCKVIAYDFEFYPDIEWSIYSNVEAWTCDAAYARTKHIKHVPMGSDVRLAGYEDPQGHRVWGGTISRVTFGSSEPIESSSVDVYLPTWISHDKPQQKIYDTTLLAHMTYRRQCVAGDLVRAGVRLSPKQEGYSGQERDMLLRQSRSMTYVHQRDEYQAIAPQRWALAAAYSLPIISETIADAAPFGYSHLLMSSYEHLAEFATMWLTRNDSHILENYGRALHSLLCHEMTFAKVIEANV